MSADRKRVKDGSTKPACAQRSDRREIASVSPMRGEKGILFRRKEDVRFRRLITNVGPEGSWKHNGLVLEKGE